MLSFAGATGFLTAVLGLFFAFISGTGGGPLYGIIAAILWIGGCLTIGSHYIVKAINRQTAAALEEMKAHEAANPRP